MTAAKVFLSACLVSLCGVAWGADAPPTIPAGARIGIIDMVTNDVTHYHAGGSEVSNFMRTYRGDWSAAELIDAPLMAALKEAGFAPLTVETTDELHKEREDWFVESPTAKKLPRGAMKELGRIMTELKLGGVIVVVAGSNAKPEFVAGERWNLLPRTVQGIGFLTTSDDPKGPFKASIFDFTQMVVVAMTSDGPELLARDWGANRIYDWAGFDPGANFKALSPAQLAPLQPVIASAIKQRITTRLVPRLKP